MISEITTQQQRLKKIIKNNISPPMKKAGFNRKGNWFNRTVSGKTTFLNVILSRWNTKENADFTLEAYVMPEGGRPIHDQAIVSERIGHLKTTKDIWYNLTSDVDLVKLGQEIEQDISEYILPFFNKYQ